jgi:hypothetical protein
MKMISRKTLLYLNLMSLLLARSLWAQTAPDPPPTVVLGVGAGLYLPTSDLGPNILLGLDGSYQLPWLGGRWGVGLGVAYSQPSTSGGPKDERIEAPGEYQTTMRELTWDMLFSFRFLDWDSRWSPHAGVGPLLYLLSHKVGAFSQEHIETSTQFGFLAVTGVDFRLWHGALVGEVRFPFATVGQRTTGNSNVGALSIMLGYRFRI